MNLTSRLFAISLLILICIVGILSLSATLGPDPSMYEPEEPGTGMTKPPELITWFRYDSNCYDKTRPWREKTICSLGGMDQCSARYCN